MRFIKVLFFSVFILLSLGDNKIYAQPKKGKWIQKDVTINYNERANSFLSTYASSICFICDVNGTPAQLGRFLMINNFSKDTIFYRASPNGLGNYASQKDIEFTSTVSNMLEYYPVLPGKKEIVEIHGYENARSKKMGMNLIVDFKFFLPNSKKLPVNNTSANSNPVSIKPQRDISFYVFFTTDFSIPQKETYLSNLKSPKTLYVISPPILHTGSLKELLLDEKAQFILEIDKQIKDKPEDLQSALLKNNYEKITVHYGKPYSTFLIKSETEGLEAIEAYKNSTKELLEGLTTFDFFQLIKY